ncbi:MAG: YkgJ family cysteine cluster protein [Gammaproteobacteria bacterium]|nr:YkgJ family cysteine cluster protein [Gammaproteobacteria bacterium]MBU1733098.1 YkgJ family cysteine cluster protein [Gammaproteobacteria bacterium]MBU1892146.1 YkgJ family cysteine cluster protein [Gammaproteobacteria bacterium]
MNAFVANVDSAEAISCATCEACCCRLEVLLMAGDDIPHRLTAVNPWGGWVMARLDDGWCAALDRNTMLCTIYERRPWICGDYQAGASDCLEQRGQLDPQGVATHDIVATQKVV